MPVQPITGQRRYRNGGSVSSGDRRLLYVGAALFGAAYLGCDVFGLPVPSGPVIQFVGHMAPVAGVWFGIYHARTRQP